MDGTNWDVQSVVYVTDGDTLRLVRSRPFPIDGRNYRLSDGDAHGIPIRLVWVDTPERGDVGWAEARADHNLWVTNAAKPLRVVCYESAGWDRILGDVIDANGKSASQWLMAERGWPPYVKGK